MKSVGEALALGRTALEALNKAIRSSETGFDGLTDLKDMSEKELNIVLTTAHPRRLLGAFTWLKRNPEADLQQLADMTGFNTWFLYQMKTMVDLESRILESGNPGSELLLEAKQAGLSDDRIAELCGKSPVEIEALRDTLGINPLLSLRGYLCR